VTGFDRLDWASYYAFKSLPTPLVSNIGGALSGRLGRSKQPYLHANARHVFARLRPDWATTDLDLDRAVDRLWACFGRGAAEMAIAPRLIRRGRVTFDDPAPLDAALASGRPVIGVFLHLGNWELSVMSVAIRARGRAAAIYGPPPQKALAAIANKIRLHAPGKLFPRSRTVWRQVITHLQSGGVILTSADASYGGVHAPCFGRPLRLDGNVGKVARLAIRTNAIVIPFYNERLPGQRFVTHVLPALEFEGSSEDDVRNAAIRIDDAIKDPIMRHLDQWYCAFYCQGLA
jgi:KDO2-lipid IV(A) lauroyltransferase